MVEEAEDTIYQRHYVSWEEFVKGFGFTKELSGHNQPKDQVVNKGSEGSIGTQTEEERCKVVGL